MVCTPQASRGPSQDQPRQCQGSLFSRAGHTVASGCFWNGNHILKLNCLCGTADGRAARHSLRK